MKKIPLNNDSKRDCFGFSTAVNMPEVMTTCPIGKKTSAKIRNAKIVV